MEFKPWDLGDRLSSKDYPELDYMLENIRVSELVNTNRRFILENKSLFTDNVINQLNNSKIVLDLECHLNDIYGTYYGIEYYHNSFDCTNTVLDLLGTESKVFKNHPEIFTERVSIIYDIIRTWDIIESQTSGELEQKIHEIRFYKDTLVPLNLPDLRKIRKSMSEIYTAIKLSKIESTYKVKKKHKLSYIKLRTTKGDIIYMDIRNVKYVNVYVGSNETSIETKDGNVIFLFMSRDELEEVFPFL